MSKVTSKLQVTLPRAIATRYGIEPGSDITFEPAGPVIVMRPDAETGRKLGREERLALFDEATRRLDALQAGKPAGGERGWTRDELYDRGLAR